MGSPYYTKHWVKIRNQHRKQSAATNAPCWLCKQPIDYTITDINDDEAYEPDHLYPRSTHPQHQHDPANLRPSHRKCNRTRSNKKATGGLGTTSRTW